METSARRSEILLVEDDLRAASQILGWLAESDLQVRHLVTVTVRHRGLIVGNDSEGRLVDVVPEEVALALVDFYFPGGPGSHVVKILAEAVVPAIVGISSVPDRNREMRVLGAHRAVLKAELLEAIGEEASWLHEILP
jgi:hypothetical protein